MIQFCNVQYDDNTFSNMDLFVCTISYEERSCFLLDKIIQSVKNDALLIFATDNYSKFEVSTKKVAEIERMSCSVNIEKYHEYAAVIDTIISSIKMRINVNVNEYLSHVLTNI